MERKEIQLLVISLGIVFFTLIIILLLFFLYFLKKKNNYLIEKIESELYFQSELVKTRIEIKDKTLSELSKELHDNIGQILSVAIMQINILLQYKKEIHASQLQDLKEIIAKSLDEIRTLSRIIDKDNLLNTNFIEAIKLDFDRIRKLKKINCVFNCTGEHPTINEEHELFIYRIFQEAIHNSIKYSHSDKFEINIATTADNLRVKFKDYGIGYELKNNSGIGLTNMKLRAKLIGAKLTIESNQSGTSVFLEYPLYAKDETLQ